MTVKCDRETRRRCRQNLSDEMADVQCLECLLGDYIDEADSGNGSLVVKVEEKKNEMDA